MRSRTLIVVGTLSAAVVCGGWFLESGFLGTGGPFSGLSLARQRGAGARLFASVAAHVARDYVDSVPADQLYQKAVEGMLYELHDPHTAFLPPARVRRLTESTTGTYVGLGIQVDIRDGWITIVAPLPGSPAERVGIQTGDRLVEINGESTRDWTQDEATAALHGVPGTPVLLLVERPGVEARIPLTLARSEIHVRAVRHASVLQPGIGYLGVAVFSDSTARELRRSVDSLRAHQIRTLILDLRNDPGGLLAQGVAVAELFLDSGQTIVTMRGRSPGSTRRYTADSRQPWPELGLVVLVNGGAASASEIVAGALQDHDRALVVGTPSYGKGSAQTLFHLDEGALKLTTALWYTPSGRSINRRSPHTDDDPDAESLDGGPAADSTASAALVYHTDAGRLVRGGGGITPDVWVRDSSAAAATVGLERAVGNRLPAFRDALTAVALAAKAARRPASDASVIDATVTPAVREALWRELRRRNVLLDRRTYDRMTPVVDRMLAAELNRYLLGPDAAFRAMMDADPIVRTALDLATRAPSPRDLVLHPPMRVEDPSFAQRRVSAP